MAGMAGLFGWAAASLTWELPSVGIRWHPPLAWCVCGYLPRAAVARMGPQLLALRRPSPHEPLVPVAYVLAQPGPLDTELITATLRVF